MFRLQAALIAAIALAVLFVGCNPSSGPAPSPPANPGSAQTPTGPQKLILKGMLDEGADLSSLITACATRAGLQLNELRPKQPGKDDGRRTAQVAVSGNFQGVANFVACFGAGGVIWELSQLQIRRGLPRPYDYRLDLQVSAFQSLTVPGPGFQDRAEAEIWFQALPARINRATALLSAVYLAAEPGIQLREIGLSQKEGEIKGRAASYPQISALMEKLEGQGLVRNARVETIGQVQTGSGEPEQDFEIRFDW